MQSTCVVLTRQMAHRQYIDRELSRSRRWKLRMRGGAVRVGFGPRHHVRYVDFSSLWLHSGSDSFIGS